MTIPEELTKTIGTVPRWQLYSAIAGIVACILGGIYFKGHSDGYDSADTKWRDKLTNAKPVETHRDTTHISQPTETGAFQAKVDSISQQYQKKVAKAVSAAMELTQAYQSESDSLRARCDQLQHRLEASLAPKLIHLQSKTIGDLILQYFPADSSANVWKHTPPDREVVTVFMEKPVLEPRSDWEVVGYVAIGTGVGILTAILSHIK